MDNMLEEYECHKQECIDSGDLGHILPYKEWVEVR